MCPNGNSLSRFSANSIKSMNKFEENGNLWKLWDFFLTYISRTYGTMKWPCRAATNMVLIYFTITKKYLISTTLKHFTMFCLCQGLRDNPVKHLRWRFWRPLTMFAKGSILDIWQISKYAYSWKDDDDLKSTLLFHDQRFNAPQQAAKVDI